MGKPYTFSERDTRLTKILLPCAKCGKQPIIHAIMDTNNGKAKTEYKLFCGAHNAWGSWYKNKLTACVDWNNKQRELCWSPDRNLGELLKPCPFCGRRMIFYREENVNRLGNTYFHQYFMHDYSGDTEESVSCMLDDVTQVFSIPAGDARPETGYIGEYATAWNKRASHF
jgi:predicted RNA-binding Zn-ribbon protein involved in translation (DUF1610 family)